jgi:hypothetical protein
MALHGCTISMVGIFPRLCSGLLKGTNPCRTLEPYPGPAASLLITSLILYLSQYEDCLLYCTMKDVPDLRIRAFDAAIHRLPLRASSIRWPLPRRRLLQRTLSSVERGVVILLRTRSFCMYHLPTRQSPHMLPTTSDAGPSLSPSSTGPVDDVTRAYRRVGARSSAGPMRRATPSSDSAQGTREAIYGNSWIACSAATGRAAVAYLGRMTV